MSIPTKSVKNAPRAWILLAAVAVLLFSAISTMWFQWWPSSEREESITFESSSETLPVARASKKDRVLVFRGRIGDRDLQTAVLRYKGRTHGYSPARVETELGDGVIELRSPRKWWRARKGKVRADRREMIAASATLQLSFSNNPTDPTDPDPPTEPRPGALKVGLITNVAGYGLAADEALDLAEPTGARWLREELSWARIEPRDDQWDFSRSDALMRATAQRGIRVLPVLMDTPSWAGRNWNTMPSDPTDYAQYAGRVSARYGPGGSFWEANPSLDAALAPEFFEIWNEPYLGVFSDGDADPARYARMFRAAGVAIEDSNPAVQLLIQADVSATDDWAEWHNWTGAMFRAVPDLSKWIDGAAVHPYVGGAVGPDVWEPDSYRARWQFPRMRDIRAEFADEGMPQIRFWITEVGWSTCSGDSNCVSEAKQAQYTQEMFDLLRTPRYSYVDAVFLYHRTDLDYGDPANKEAFFGMQRLDGSRKPVFGVFRAAAAESG